MLKHFTSERFNKNQNVLLPYLTEKLLLDNLSMKNAFAQ